MIDPLAARERARRDALDALHRRRQRVIRQCTAGRFLSDAGIDLSALERRHLRDIQDWRLLVVRHLRASEISEQSQIYCFGAGHGGTVRELAQAFRLYETPLPTMHAFDSFQGLPDERPGVSAPPHFSPGAYAASRSMFERRVEAAGATRQVVIHDGWFSATLQPALVAAGVFQPAAYVDIDADLYGSTMDALDFMFAHRLIRKGTLIGYDDWGDTDLFTAGESRAHLEATRRYGASCSELLSWGEPPLIRKLFRVDAVAHAGEATDAGAIRQTVACADRAPLPARPAGPAGSDTRA